MPTLNLSQIPFTCPGSFLKITAMAASRSGRLQVSTVRMLPIPKLSDKSWAHDFYEIALFKGETEVKYQWEATPWQLDLHADGGEVSLAFQDCETLALTAKGVTVKLLPCHPFAMTHRYAPDAFTINDYSARCYHTVRARRGTKAEWVSSLTIGGEQGAWIEQPCIVIFSGRGTLGGAIRFEPYGVHWKEPLPAFESVVAARQREWEAWRCRMPRVPERYTAAAEMAWAVLWGCIVNPDGALTRRVLYMSKHWMNQIWSWDNCFDALGVACADPELAFDQLRLMFDHQAPTGAFPDSVHNMGAVYHFVKPPVYGWTIMGLTERLGPARMKRFMREAYEPIKRNTEFWYTYRDSDHDGMCEYWHGNDSGWDNATVFDQGYPTEGADLAAHLVLQTEGLALMAQTLGKSRDAAAWKRRSQAQLKNLLKQGVKNNRFFSPLSGKRSAPETQSLLNYVPAVLGPRLPKPILKALVADLSPGGPFLTDYGLATQAPGSKTYQPDGYWRGPIWAPSTYLIFDGLRRAGENELAHTIATRFCDMCAKAPACWENFDALTGQGLRCAAYSWTGAVFLLMAEWLAQSER